MIKVYAAEKANFREVIQPTEEEFKKYLADGFNIIQEEPEEKVIARYGYPQDLDGFVYPETRHIMKIGGAN